MTRSSNRSEAPASRREFLKLAGGAATVSVLAGLSVPAVHAAENATIKLALVGCGGRGTGAVADAFSTSGGPVKLYAMADLFEHRLKGSQALLEKQFADRVERESGSQLPGIRRLPEGHRLSRAGRRGDPDHAGCLPPAALRICRPERP